MMGFKLTNTGLQMILDIEVPDTIASHFPAIIHPFRKNLKNYGYGSSDISSWWKNSANSRSIVLFGQNIDDTKEVLRLYGNMSSATVLYVLERFMDNRPQKKEKFNVKFWPWISAQRVLLQF
jgi:predicted naringenin-chalcone synthase